MTHTYYYLDKININVFKLKITKTLHSLKMYYKMFYTYVRFQF